MQLNETYAFVAVVEAGSFTQASRGLGVPKSTLSKRVSRLEARLGARLLQRTTRKLALTDTGRAYFTRCHAAIADIVEAERLAEDVSGVPMGLLRVSCPFDFGGEYLARWIPEFRSRYPKVELDVLLTQSRVDIVAERIDVALRGGELADSSFVSRRLMSSEVVLCASPTYLDRRGRPQRLAELDEHDTVTMRGVAGGLTLKGPDGHAVFKVDAWLVANDWKFLREAMIAGYGIGPSMIQVVRDDLAHGRLERVLPQYSGGRGGLYALYPSRHHLSPKVRAFVDFVADKVDSEL